MLLQKHPDLYSASSGVHIKEISIKFYSIFFFLLHSCLILSKSRMDSPISSNIAICLGYSGLNEKGLHRIIYLNTLSPVVELLVKSRRYGLGSIYVPKGGVCCFQRLVRSLCSLYLVIVDQDVSFCCPFAVPSYTPTLSNQSQIKCFLYECVSHCIYHSNKRELRYQQSI